MIKEYYQMTNLQKAAALMLVLPEDASSALFSRLEPAEIKHLAQAMSTLDTVHPSVIEALLTDFASQMVELSPIQGGFETTEKLLAKVLPKEQLAGVMDEIRMWDKLSNVKEETLAQYLQNEYPQTIAVVLSRLKPIQASRVLSFLPETLSEEVLMRMLNMEVVQPDVLEELENTLRRDFMSHLERSVQKDSHEFMAEIFNNLDQTMSDKYMGALETQLPNAAERIRNLMFKFEDLIRLNAAGIQSVIKVVDKGDLAIALKGAMPEIKNFFFSNMSKRASQMLDDDIESMGPIRVREVNDAQRRIVAVAKELIDSGQVMLAGANKEDQYIE